MSHIIIGEFVTQVRVRELIHETPVYRIEGSSTNHPDDPLTPPPGSVSVFMNNVIYTIESNTGIIRLGNNGPTYIRIGGRYVSDQISYNCLAVHQAQVLCMIILIVTFKILIRIKQPVFGND